MERLDNKLLYTEIKSNPHYHLNDSSNRCCEHKFGDCCHLSKSKHLFNDNTMEPTKPPMKVTKEVPMNNDQWTELLKIQELENKLKAQLLNVGNIRSKVQTNLEENRKLIEGLRG